MMRVREGRLEGVRQTWQGQREVGNSEDDVVWNWGTRKEDLVANAGYSNWPVLSDTGGGGHCGGVVDFTNLQTNFQVCRETAMMPLKDCGKEYESIPV